MKYIRNKVEDSTFADIDFCFIFKVNHVFMEETDNSVEKVVIDEEDLDRIEIDDILKESTKNRVHRLRMLESQSCR